MSQLETIQPSEFDSNESSQPHPVSWNLIALENCISDFIDYRGKAPPKTEKGIPLITARNVREGFLDFTAQEFIDSNKYDQWMVRGIPSVGDVLFTTEAPLGNACMYPEGKFAVAQRLITLKPDRSILDGRFLMYYLLSNEGKTAVQFRKSGSTATGIKQSELRKVEIPLPPLNEQRKIAEILSCWDNAINKYEQLIDRTAFSFRRLIKEFLGDGRTKSAGLIDVAVEDCCDILDTKRKPLNKEQRKDDQGEIPYYGANGKVGAVDDWIFDEPLILIAEDGGYFDEYKTRPIAYRINGKSWVNNHAHVLKAKPQFDQNCIFFCLVHKDISAFLNGGTRAKLNRKELEKIAIQLPSSLEKQQLVGSTLDSICTEINLLGSILDRLHQEKLALMQKLLTGNIRVKV